MNFFFNLTLPYTVLSNPVASPTDPVDSHFNNKGTLVLVILGSLHNMALLAPISRRIHGRFQKVQNEIYTLRAVPAWPNRVEKIIIRIRPNVPSIPRRAGPNVPVLATCSTCTFI